MSRLHNSTLKTALIIFLSFLLTSTGHLSWMYHLMELTSATVSHQISTVAGYAAQAAGIAVFAVIARHKRFNLRTLFICALIAYSALLYPSVLGTSLTISAVFGLILSFFCGIISGYYIYELTESAAENLRATAFGMGYGAATTGSFLLSIIGGGSIYYGKGILIICVVLAALSAFAAFINTSKNESGENDIYSSKPHIKLKTLLLICGSTVLLFSLVNNIGFAFSASEVKNGLRPEASRLFYAAGLIAGGFFTDKSRKYGAVCAMAALVVPFVVQALKNETIPLTIFWALGYFAFGFYSVFRVVLFSDIAKSQGLMYISGAGLLIGRIGDSAGSEINAVLSVDAIALIILAAALFIASVFLFIKLYQTLYIPSAKPPKTEVDIFDDFSINHNLSVREREVLRLLLNDMSNKEISADICVSENTVKFHVRNLLKKTGCKNRVELKSVYHSFK